MPVAPAALVSSFLAPSLEFASDTDTETPGAAVSTDSGWRHPDAPAAARAVAGSAAGRIEAAPDDVDGRAGVAVGHDVVRAVPADLAQRFPQPAIELRWGDAVHRHDFAAGRTTETQAAGRADPAGDLQPLGNFYGTDANEYFAGTSDPDAIYGYGGNDTLSGGGSGGFGDRLVGGTGNDLYYINETQDLAIDEAGYDTAQVSVNSYVVPTGSSGIDEWQLQSGVKIFSLQYLGGGTVIGNSGVNWIYGNGGFSTVYAGAGDDEIIEAGYQYGEAGNDVLRAAFHGAGNFGSYMDGGTGNDTMIGSVGNDTFVVDSVLDVVNLDTIGGVDAVESWIGFDLYSKLDLLRNLTLLGSNAIDGFGNNQANRLVGNSGNNRLDGRAGGDTMEGGAGNDTYIVDQAGDVIIELEAQGTDTVVIGANHTLGANLENLTLVGVAVSGTGNSLDNVITGNAAANLLDGGTGADTLVGGGGDDTYSVGEGDVVTELAAQGTDTVLSSASHALADHVEWLILSGGLDIDGTGNASNNRIDGNAGANRLDGAAGADTLAGGEGDDIYGVDDPADLVVEAEGQGRDQVVSSIDYTLGAHLEDLLLQGSALAGAGNALANRIDGNSLDNLLDGAAGADTMTGGAGDDTYRVDNAGDVLVELADGGTDTIVAVVGHLLQDHFENLRLEGLAALDGTGNGLGNRLVGNAAANVLDGAAGADTMEGGAGDDLYFVDDAGDVVIEASDQGIDSVQSAVSFTLGSAVERLTLTGSASIDATGNALANLIVGNSGDNRLEGGAGNDTLRGGTGNDIYVLQDFDVVSENTGEGIDEVQTAGSYSLAGTLENLRLLGTGHVNGTGNGADNLLFANAGNNVLNGETGIDTVSYAQADSAVVVRLILTGAQATGGSGTDTLLNIENLSGSAYADSLAGGVADNRISGEDGNDFLEGLKGNDTLEGGAGDDSLLGGAGNDSLAGGAGNDIYALQGADQVVEAEAGGIDEVRTSGNYAMPVNIEILRLQGTGNINGVGNAQDNLIHASAGNNSINGGAGTDTVSYAFAASAVSVSLAVTTAQATGGSGSDTLSKLENLAGSAFDDTLSGNGSANRLDGADGVDTLDGGAGDDTLVGGGGNDLLIGGTGNDVYALQGADTIVENSGEGIDEVQTAGNLGLAANFENLRLTGTGHVNGTGNSLDNVIFANGGNNSLNGAGGVDTVSYADAAGGVAVSLAIGGAQATLGSGTDTLANFENLAGSGHADTLAGNAAANVIDGLAGNDTLSGDAGADTFVLRSLIGSDTITDFISGLDRLSIVQRGITVGNGDASVDGAVNVPGPGGFAVEAELVIVDGDIAGEITAASAAAAIGSASTAYAIGQKTLFMVDNGSSSALYLFGSLDTDALVEAGELTLLATLVGTGNTTTGDILFGG